MKSCIDCFATKDITMFPKRGTSCKQCVSIYMAQYRKDNKTRIAQLKKDWKLNNSEHVKARDKAYALLHPERRAQAHLKWRLANPELNRQHKAKYAENNKGIVRASKRNWVINNPDKLRIKHARRRASKLNATPKWETSQDRETIAHIYWLANEFSKACSVKYEVDHIIPLQGDFVSGLHTPLNLQILPAVDNRKKSNTYEF